jgi:hypothetical protein
MTLNLTVNYYVQHGIPLAGRRSPNEFRETGTFDLQTCTNIDKAIYGDNFTQKQSVAKLALTKAYMYALTLYDHPKDNKVTVNIDSITDSNGTKYTLPSECKTIQMGRLDRLMTRDLRLEDYVLAENLALNAINHLQN